MTPEQAISAAFRAASAEIARGMTVQRGEAYQTFLIQTGETIENAAKAWSSLAVNRPGTSTEQAAQFEMYAYFQIIQATIGCLMALAHFPYLSRIDARDVTEKLC